VRQISFLACFLLVLLRVSIGWQFLYEGLWKLGTQKTSKPWSAEGYLVNARGPLRDKFREMVDDPNGLNKLDYDKVAKSWDDWRDRFVSLYSDVPNIGESVDRLLEGPKEFTQKLDQLPDGVDLKSFKKPKGFRLEYNPKAKQLETDMHLLPAERDALIAMAGKKATADEEAPAEPEADAATEEKSPDDEPADGAEDPVVKKWRDAVNALYKSTSKLSLKERLQVLLKEDPDRVGVILESQQGTIDHERPGKKQVYEHLLSRYEKNLKDAQAVRLGFQNEHLDKQWREILEKRAELVGPVDALTAEFHANAYKLLDAAQSQRGPVPEPDSKIRQINLITMWSLTILGVALMAGLFSRLSALGAAGLLLLFYLPMPPWPGVPEPPGPEHSLYVNKNLIEFIACLALASMPTGRWIGIDAFIRRFIFRRKTD
jgi:uncharacterized membrane protein YphA (DoxX/SURF4 family)